MPGSVPPCARTDLEDHVGSKRDAHEDAQNDADEADDKVSGAASLPAF